MWYTKYLGRKFDEKHFDCLDLLLEIYQKDRPKLSRSQLELNFNDYITKDDTGEIVLFRTPSNRLHIGILIDDQNVLHNKAKVGVVVEPLYTVTADNQKFLGRFSLL